MNGQKNRNISILEFLKNLQYEYIIAELRHKIYPKKKDKDYYFKLMEFKKKKILDISIRNKLPNIFNDEIVKQGYYDTVYPEIGCPNFIYPTEDFRLEFEKQDAIYYYTENTDFRIEKDNKILTGILKKLMTKIAILIVDGKEISVEKEKISRIL